ncbi:MAG: hypothetical protein H7281_13395 [Bacteriovorax sp.]|nr:hypothetical protein [Bacteriovorax sp.]
MTDLKNLSEIKLQELGESILSELNISLFNAEPTIHKAYQIYFELVHAGYCDQDKQLACEKIKRFITTRTVRNQRKEFQALFKIPFTDNMRPIFSLSFRTSVISPEVVRKVSFRINRILSDLDVGQNLKIDDSVIYTSISELFNPHYHENEWRITIPALFGKIKKNLIVRGIGLSLDSLEEFFYKIDPNPKKKKLRGLKLVKGSVDPDVGGANLQANTTNERKDVKRFDLDGTIGPVGSHDETLQTRTNVIKESELEYVKAILELINSDEVQETLCVDLYQSDKRHPLITNFLNLVKSYNLIMGDGNMKLIDSFRELKVVVRGLRETGEEVQQSYREVVGGRVAQLHFEIKKVS